MIALDPIYIDSVVRAALEEDIGSGDITTLLTIPEDSESAGEIIARESGVIAGQEVAAAVFHVIDPAVVYEQIAGDGTTVDAGDRVAKIAGSTRAILTGERTALNFLQRMSGVASLTSIYVELVSNTRARIVDTRKTTPGLRRLEKYAVACGGGFNHRFGLSDGILIKDNHIAAAGGVTAAVSAARRRAPHGLKVEVEVTSVDQVDEALQAGADVVLLDNMAPDLVREAVQLVGGRVMVEASGGVTEETVAEIAETGVDLISVGALTHSAAALDISLNIIAS